MKKWFKERRKYDFRRGFLSLFGLLVVERPGEREKVVWHATKVLCWGLNQGCCRFMAYAVTARL